MIKLGFCMHIIFLHAWKLAANWYNDFDRWSSTPKVPKIASLQRAYNTSKKKLEEVDFLHMQINIKVSYKLISTLWPSKFPTVWFYHYWLVWSSILKVLKLKSLQYLYNISKKKLGMEFIFCKQINLNVFSSLHYRF